MKTKHLILTFISVILVSMFHATSATAQQNIDRVVKEIEDEGIDMNTVITRNPQTKKIKSIVKSFSFLSKGDVYARKLKDAFMKDSEDCSTSTINGNSKNKGKLNTTITLIFENNVYCLSITGNGTPHRVSVSIVYDYSKDNGSSIIVNDKTYGDFSMLNNSFDSSDFKGSMKELKENMKNLKEDLKGLDEGDEK